MQVGFNTSSPNLGINLCEQKEEGILQTLFRTFIPNYTLNEKIRILKNNITHVSYKMHTEDQQLIQVAFIKGQTLFGKKLLQSLAELPLEKTLPILSSFLDESKDAAYVYDALYNFLHYVTEKDLQEYLELDNESMSYCIRNQADVKDFAVKNLFDTHVKPIWRTCLKHSHKFIYQFIEILIAITGANNILVEEGYRYEEKMSEYEAQSKIQSYWALLGCPSVLFGFFLAYSRSSKTSVILTVGSIVAGIFSITFYNFYLKPCPTSFKGLENLSNRDTLVSQPPLYRRKNLVNGIIDVLSSNQGVLLTAPPGVGKTTLVNALADTINDKECREEFYKKQVFSLTASEIGTYPSPNLIEISNRFANYPEGVIIFIDEIESLFVENPVTHKSALESLLVFQSKFHYVICATTTAQYKRTIQGKAEAFDRRFTHISVPFLNETEVESALRGHLYFKAPQLELEPGVISHIIDHAKEYNPKTSQIDASTSILASAITKATYISFNQLEGKIYELEVELNNFKKIDLQENLPILSHDLEQKKREDLEQQIAKAKAELAQKKAQVEHIKKTEKVYLKCKQNNFRIAFKAKKNPKLQKSWLVNQICSRFICDYVEQKRIDADLPPKITKIFIDQIIRERKAFLAETQSTETEKKTQSSSRKPVRKKKIKRNKKKRVYLAT